MTVEVLNVWYILLFVFTMALFIGLTVYLYIWHRDNKKFTKIFIASMLWFALVLHFLRLPYVSSQWGGGVVRHLWVVSPMSICAVSTFIFPFIFMSKNKVLKDYMFYIGILSGLLAMLYPGAIMGERVGFDAVRFYVAHGIISFAPLMMVLCGHHEINWRRCWTPIPILLMVLCFILVNEVLLMATGLIEYDMQRFLSSANRNAAMIWGLDGDYGVVNRIMDFLTPEVFRTALFDVPEAGIVRGDVMYWPIVWMIVPGVIVFVPVLFGISMIFDRKGFKRDIQALKLRFKKEEK